VSVLAIASCASQGSAVAVNYDMAKVYLADKGPAPGQSGNFWDGLEGVKVAKYPWGGGSEDASGIFYLAADGNNLYMRAEIQDCAPQVRSTDMDPSLSWNGTSLQFFFGTDTKKRSEYSDSDSGLSFWVVQNEAGNDFSPENLKVMVSKGRLLNERQCKAVVVDWTDSSYIIEASMPLDVLGIYKPFKAGQKVMAEFRINHAKIGEDRSVIVNWRTSTDDAWKDPNTWSFGIVEKKS